MTILSSTMLAHEVNDWAERTQAEAGQIWVQIQSLGFPGGSDGKESTCNAGDPGLIPRSRRSLEKRMATHSSIPAWEILWTEEPGGLQTMGSQKSRT